MYTCGNLSVYACVSLKAMLSHIIEHFGTENNCYRISDPSKYFSGPNYFSNRAKYCHYELHDSFFLYNQWHTSRGFKKQYSDDIVLYKPLAGHKCFFKLPMKWRELYGIPFQKNISTNLVISHNGNHLWK